jgi:murein DD-endopeptidase MepM/ murein hydrolase activator NlpD
VSFSDGTSVPFSDGTSPFFSDGTSASYNQRVFSLIALAAAIGTATGSLTITTRSRAVAPGEIVIVTITSTVPVAAPAVRAFNQPWSPYPVNDRTWRVLVGIDVDVAPGKHPVTVEAGAERVTHTLVVVPKAFPTRRLTVDNAFVNPPESAQKRIDEESKLVAEIWKSSAPEALWKSPFVRPVPQPANSAFGTRSVFNGQRRGAHGGADFPSPAGTPVKAPNAGRIVLVRNLYFSGNTVIVDHGLGLFSYFAHLSDMTVAEGELVEAGATVGHVGATGRVTGPHLHWMVRAGAARVDPLSLLALLGEAPRTK